MRSKLSVIFLFLIGFVMLSHAQSIKVNLGNAVKHKDGAGVYYTFPSLSVVASDGLRIRSVSIDFKQGTATYRLPAGWKSKPLGYSPYGSFLENESGVSASDAQTFLRSIQYKFSNEYKGGELEIQVCNYINSDPDLQPSSISIQTRKDEPRICSRYDKAYFGFESTKSASVNDGGVNNGTLAAPVKVLLGDIIEYKIEAVNAAPQEEGGGQAMSSARMGLRAQGEPLSTLIIEDKLPEGLEVVPGSITEGGVENSGMIKWTLENVPRGVNKVVTFKAKLKVPLIPAYYQNIMKNTAKVTTQWEDMLEPQSGELSLRRGELQEYISQTDTTYHQRAVCTVKFTVDPAAGGALTNGNDQVIDYGTKPAAGVTVTPSGAAYKFKGWKHGGFTSLKDGEAAAPAASGPEGDANWYTTVDVKGDVTFTAEMVLQGYAITYDYNDKASSPKGQTMPLATPPTVANPTGYITSEIPSGGIPLNAPTRIGYVFNKWLVTKTADGTQVSDNNIIPEGTQGDLKATAQWTPKRFGIGYELDGGNPPATPNPTHYTIETLPEKVQHAPTKAGYTFVGWTNDRFAPTTQMTVDIPLKDAAGHYTQDSLTFYAHWHQKIVVDTVTCEGPLRLKGMPGAKSYKWEYLVSATEKKEVGNAQHFDAEKSGTYVLTTDYGTVNVQDTFKVLFAFEGKQELKNNKHIPAKIGRKQEFYVKMDTVGRNVSYKWSLTEGDTTHSMKGDSLYVVFRTSGKKEVGVEITVTLPSGLICKKVLSASIVISEKYNGFFVDQHVQGGREDGSSWANAYRRIEQALDKARAGDCVWVARGVYTPPTGKSYEMKYDSVEVYGGFGAWESYLHERVFASNQTIVRRSDNGSSVIVIEGSKGMRWDGFTIEQGQATQGGGILNKNGQVTIANCIIRNNRADQGGGIYNGNGGDAVIFNTEISGNTATDGAGMYNHSAHPRLTNVTISGNLASNQGGGLYNDGSNPDVRNTILWGNRAAKFPNVSNTGSTPMFSFSLIEKDRAGWDVALGSDQGGNIDGSPVFRKRGFDESGAMRESDYRLGANSAAENQGLNRYVYVEKTRDAHLPTLNESEYHSGFPYDLSGMNRIIEDRVDIGAYEYAPDITFPKVSREIVIPTVKGLTFQPTPGIHYVNTGDDFTFSVKEEESGSALKAGEKKRLIERLKITTGDPIRDKDGIEMTENEDGSVTVKLIKVTEGITLTVDPHANSSAVVTGEKVWSYKDHVLLSVKASTDVRIYDLEGRLVDARKVNAGETSIALPQGIYLVRIADRSYKVILR